MVVQFRDSAINIGSPADGDLDINADDEIELNSTLIDINGNVEISGTAAITGIATFTDDIIIGDGKTIGSASDVDAMTIASNGQVTFTQTLIGTALDISGDIDVDGTTNLDIVDIDGAVDMASTLQVDGAITTNGNISVVQATPTITLTDTDQNTDAVIFSDGGTGRGALFLSADHNDERDDTTVNLRVDGDDVVIVGHDTTTLNRGVLSVPDGSASAPSITNTGDTNTGIFFPAADTIAFAEGGAEAARFDSGGRLLIGNTTSVAVGATDFAVQVQGTDFATSSNVVQRYADSTAGGMFAFAKSRNATVGSQTIVQDGDQLGKIRWYGSNGSNFTSYAAEIEASVDGTPGSGGDTTDMPGRLVFMTTGDGAGSPTERMRINNKGNVGFSVVPETDWRSTESVLQFGSSGALWGGTSANYAYLSSNLRYDGTNFKYINTDEASYYLQNSAGEHIFTTAASGSADANITFIENLRMNTAATVFNEGDEDIDFRIESNNQTHCLFVDGGNDKVSIGTSANSGAAETGKLKVRHDVDYASVEFEDNATLMLQNEQNNCSAVIVLHSNNSSGSSKRSGIVGGQINSNLNGLGFYGDIANKDEGNKPQVFIDGDGNMMTKKTTLGTANAGCEMRADGLLVATRVATQQLAGLFRLDNATGEIVRFQNGSSDVGSIDIDSNSTSYNTSSDYRLKENVDYDWDATTRLKQLKPARFNWISDDTNRTIDGFLAHEAQAVVPECATGTHNEVDDDGNAVMQGIDQSKLVPLLVKTIQELEARITALES